MIRRLKSEVLNQLPSKQRKMIVLDPSFINTKSQEMKTHCKKMEQRSLSSMQRRGVLLEWFNATGSAKVKAVLEYIKYLLEGDKKFLCFAHHQVGNQKLLTLHYLIYYLNVDNDELHFRSFGCPKYSVHSD